MGIGTGVNSYPPVDMGNPIGLFFFSRRYDYGIVKSVEYLTIAISSADVLAWEHKSGSTPR
jgi:hypothetical protein